MIWDKMNHGAITGESQATGTQGAVTAAYNVTAEDRAGRKDNVLRAWP